MSIFSAKTEEDIDNLINNGVDINTQDTFFGQTYLHILVQSRSSLLDYFLTKGPNTNIKNKDGKTPIFYAKDMQTMEKLINHGALPLIPLGGNESLVSENDVIRTNNSDNSDNSDNFNNFNMSSIFNAKTETDIDNLINNGADINTQDSFFGQTYLHILVQSRNSLLDYFLTKGPNTNIKNKDGKTPIFYAKDIQTMEKLINHGASLLIKDLSGNTANEYNRSVSANFIQYYINKLRNKVVA